MAVIDFNTNRVEITGLTHDSTFHDVDLSSFVDDDTEGVIIEIVNTSNTNYEAQIRCNGSTDNLVNNMRSEWRAYTHLAVKIDASNIIEISSQNSALKYYVVAKLKTGTVLNTNWVDKSIGTTDVWTDVDITANVGADAGDVEAAILSISSAFGTSDEGVGVRRNGSTDTYENFQAGATNSGYYMAIVGVDDSNIFEHFVENVNYSCYLVGYIKKNVGYTAVTDPSSQTATTTSSWTDLDLTAATSADAVGAILRFGNTDGSRGDYRLRENGSTTPETPSRVYSWLELAVGFDAGQVIEYYTSDSTNELAVVGYVEEVASGDSVNDERSAKITGKDSDDDERAAKIVGQDTDFDERSAKTTGVATDSDERSAKVSGIDTDSDERAAKVVGKETSSSERGAKITGNLDDVYSREFVGSLPVDDATLGTIYSSQEVTDVSDNDDVFVDLVMNDAGFGVHEFKKYNSNNQEEQFTVTARVKSDLAASTSTIYLQVFNRDTSSWETLDSDNSTGADTEFVLTGGKSSDLSDYFDANYVVAFRVYQEAV